MACGFCALSSSLDITVFSNVFLLEQEMSQKSFQHSLKSTKFFDFGLKMTATKTVTKVTCFCLNLLANLKNMTVKSFFTVRK